MIRIKERKFRTTNQSRMVVKYTFRLDKLPQELESNTGPNMKLSQVTGEKLGTAQRTDYDREFQDLCNRVDKHSFWASMLTSKVELVLQPNPGGSNFLFPAMISI